MSFLSCEKCGINKVENEKKMDKLTKMSEADEIIRKLNTEQRDYLNRYFAHAPESVTGSMQVVRMPEGTTFIQEGMPVDKVYVLLKGCVSAVDYRVRETVYGFVILILLRHLVLGNLRTYGSVPDYAGNNQRQLISEDTERFL